MLLTFILSYSGGHPAVDIHDVPFVPASEVFPDVNDVSGVASFTTFASIPAFAGISTALAVLLLLSFLLLYRKYIGTDPLPMLHKRFFLCNNPILCVICGRHNWPW
jgi:hypothetical protein